MGGEDTFFSYLGKIIENDPAPIVTICSTDFKGVTLLLFFIPDKLFYFLLFKHLLTWNYCI